MVTARSTVQERSACRLQEQNPYILSPIGKCATGRDRFITSDACGADPGGW
jgi:hypothetical protein